MEKKSIWERIKQFVSRHKLETGVFSGLALLCVAGIILLSVSLAGAGGGNEVVSQNSGADTSSSQESSTSSTPSSYPESSKPAIQEPVGPKSDPVLTVRETALPGYEKVVTVCTVTDFGAVPGDGLDDTWAFQRALNYAEDQGGGTVYVPAGVYDISGYLRLAPSCTLLGEWYAPGTGKMQEGTVLQAYSGEGMPSSTPFISVGTASAVIGVTVYYPNQNAENPVPYPATFKAIDGEGGRSGFPTIKYTTLVNSYLGVSFGPDWNEMGILENVYMTPLSKGVFVNMTTDIGRIEELHIGAAYYAEYDKSVDKDALTAYMKSHVIGVELERSDWQYMYKSTIADVADAIIFKKQSSGTLAPVDSCNAQIYDLTIDNCTRGLVFKDNKMNSQITNVKAVTDEECILIEAAFTGSAAVNTADLTSTGGSCVRVEEGSIGAISLVDSRFRSWKGGSYGLQASGGGVLLENCEAEGPGTAVLLADGVRGASLHNQGLAVDNRIGEKAVLAEGGEALGWQNRIPENLKGVSPAVTGTAFVDVLAQGADNSGMADNTAYIQEALDSAAAQGGGIVYLAAGRYRVDGTLTIPTGVELRGVAETGHHSNADGTVLYTTQGKGQEDGTPFITLKSGAGLRGILIWYPEQVQDTPYKYPWAIDVTGENAWVVYTTVGNGWQGLRLSQNSGGHYVSYFCGFNFQHDILVDGSQSRGYILNCHFNPHFYGRTTTLPGGGSAGNSFMELLGLSDNTKDGSVVLGEAVDEVLFNSFNYRGGVGLRFIDSGNGFDGILLGCGFDGVRNGVIADKTASNVLIVNFLSDVVPGDPHYMVLNNGDLTMVNSGYSSYGFTAETGIQVKGGSLKVRQMGFGSSCFNGAFLAEGGKLDITAVTFTHRGPIQGDDFRLQTNKECRDIAVMGGDVTFGSGLAKSFKRTHPADGIGGQVAIY